MATLVCFHAHPDDESISTGGVMALAASAGHRVVLVVATDGRHGERPEGVDSPEALVERRRAETEASAAALGIHRVAWLGYHDSGMTGWEHNDHPSSFHRAALEDAAARLAAILVEETADVVTVYDWHGNYGHPDHVKVHHVGHRAAVLAGTGAVYEATMNRDHMRRLMAMQRELLGTGSDAAGSDGTEGDRGFDVDGPADDGNPFGMPEAELTTMVDVRAALVAKRASMACHRSQITDTSLFLEMPDEAFAVAFGTEWFIRRGAPAGIHEHGLAGLW
ncbi:MAG: PIG-L deacetylase family protein [Acidimicrobiales bacterium]